MRVDGATLFKLSGGYSSGTINQGASISADSSVIVYGVYKAGVETPIPVRLASFAGGDIQIDNGSVLAEFKSDTFQPHKVYRALLSQSSHAAPVATVLENSLGGTVVWTRTGTGVYTGTLSGAFTASKTLILVGTTGNDSPTMDYAKAFRIDHDSVEVVSISLSDNSSADELLT